MVGASVTSVGLPSVGAGVAGTGGSAFAEQAAYVAGKPVLVLIL